MRYGYADPACPINWGHPLNRGLISCWSVLPNPGWRGGLTLRDLAVGGRTPNNGTLAGGVAWVGGGRPGGCGAIAFDASDDYMVFGVPTRPVNTVSFWYKAPASISGNPGVLMQGNDAFSSAAWDWGFYHGSASSLVVHYQGSTNDTMAITAGAWQHITLVRRDYGDMARAYLNGRLVFGPGANSTGPTNVYAIRTLNIATVRAAGTYDDIRLYDRPLSAGEVLALYRESQLGHPHALTWLLGRGRAWQFGAIDDFGPGLTRWDSFDRVNSAAELGPPSDGGAAWVAALTPWGVTGSKAYAPESGGYAHTECGDADGEVGVTLSTLAGYRMGLVARVTDSSNCLIFEVLQDANLVRLYRREAGGNNLLRSESAVSANGDVATMVLDGSTVTCKLNGVTVISAETITFNNTATRHGMWCSGVFPAARLENWYFTAPAAPAAPGTPVKGYTIYPPYHYVYVEE